MKQILCTLFALVFASLSLNGWAFEQVTYVHSDGQGKPVAGTDENGNKAWTIEYYPFGGIYNDTASERENDLGFAYKPFDAGTGLSYFGARHYDPSLGRFTGIDPVGVNPSDFRTFNRYSYGFNNPNAYVDPDGNLPFLIPVVAFVAKEAAAEGLSYATGGLTDFLSFRKVAVKGSNLAFKSFKKSGGDGAAKGTQLQRNQAAGAAFEQKVKGQLQGSQTGVVEQVTIKTQSGVRTRIDLLGRDSTGAIRCTECKASATAPLTKNQRLGFPEIQQSGGVVVGKGKPGFPGGTKIPPTKVDIVRPGG